MSLKYASDTLKDDWGIVKVALEKDPYALKYASNRFKADEKLVAMAVKVAPQLYSHGKLPRKMYLNPKVAYIAVMSETNFGYAFPFLNSKLQNDPSFVLNILKNKPEFFKDRRFTHNSKLTGNPILQKYVNLSKKDRIALFEDTKKVLINSLNKDNQGR